MRAIAGDQGATALVDRRRQYGPILDWQRQRLHATLVTGLLERDQQLADRAVGFRRGTLSTPLVVDADAPPVLAQILLGVQRQLQQAFQQLLRGDSNEVLEH